ncbi:MAG TPA: hypothetical protein VMS75_03155 [Terriglobales bacterium]|nr:hypothetical protein [Terriglobales bacterium]
MRLPKTFAPAIAILLAAAAVAAPPLAGQADKPASGFGISLSGYVKTDIFYDSRQTVNFREGHFLLFPKEPSLDPLGRDINAKSSFNILSIQTRLAGKITGPDVLGAKTSAYIEAEFFGTSDADLNGFRLRHAYLTLKWTRSELMVGQFWHPMFVTDCYPDVVSFNTGAPFQPFNRSPQVRFTQTFGRWSVSATALAQRDFVSNGPQGASAAYLRNAALPELNLKLQYAKANGAEKTETVAGAEADFLKLVPRLATASGYKTDESVRSLAGMAYLKVRRPGWTFKAEGVYGSNLYHLTMQGGYAVRDEVVLAGDVPDAWAYSPTSGLSLWSEVQTNGAPWQAGLFGGYFRNFGARFALAPVAAEVFSRGPNIADLYRVSPRLLYNVGKMRFAAEAELTGAAYGTPDAFGRVRGAKTVTNLRLLLAAYYFF